MVENSNYVLIKTKEVVLPFGYSKVPQVLDEEEELLLIQAVKANKEIVFVNKSLDGLSEFGCLAKVSSYNYDNSIAKYLELEFGEINQKLQASGHTMIPIYKKSDLLVSFKNISLGQQQFSDISEVELLLLHRISLTTPIDVNSITILEDIEEEYNRNDFEKLSSIIFENIDELSIDCVHSLSFYALSILLQGCSDKINQYKMMFLKSNSENQRIKTLISLYTKGLLR